MAEQGACSRCGTPRTGSASFCPVCDTFLGWHDDETPIATVAETEAARASDSDQATPPAPPTPPPAPPPVADRVRPPVVSTETSEVVVATDAPGTFSVAIRNSSTIVDSYTLQVADPPAWLSIEHGDTNLLPDETRTVQVTVAVRPGTLAVAQRLHVTVGVGSTVDPTKAAEVPLTVVVPPSGPPASLVAHPALVRLEDRAQGSFALRLDNRASNHPRQYRLSASDPEGAVVLDFVPSVVRVSAGQVADATVRFAAPEPAPGKDATRQLTVTATDEESPVTVQVTIAQVTSPEPERRPVRLRLEPSQVSAVDVPSVGLNIVVDNRAGHEDAVVSLRGRDPANVLSFAFDHDGFTVGAGRAVRLGMSIWSAPVPRGGSVTRPFTVVAFAGGAEVEVSGTFELTSRPAAIATARLFVVPDHLVVSSRRGTYSVELDNRQGAEPLQVALSGADEFGRAGLSFSPSHVAVPPGGVGRATLTVKHPKPTGGASASRRVRVTASAGPDAVHGEAVFTQEARSYRRWWGIVAVVVGALLAVVGVLLATDDPELAGAESAVRSVIEDAQSGSMPGEDEIRLVVAVVALGIVLLSAVIMLFGLAGTTGRSIRVAAVLAALAAVAATVSTGVMGGIALVLVGAVLAFVGGILVRSAAA